jgi:uncharacterized pyridoxal phosphate-containing UPF0001 family protein
MLVLSILRRLIIATALKELLMGMSNDEHVVVEEGTTMVRSGTAIVGTRRA